MRVAIHACGLAIAVLAAWLVLCGETRTRADEASGRWTGEFEARGNYYYERSTRVNAPAAKLSVEAPNGVRMNVNYLADVITSASVAQTGGGSDALFTELRHGFGSGVGKTFSLGENELDLNAHAIYSTEPDYKSWILGAFGSYSFDEKNTTLSLGLTRVMDTVLKNTDSTFRERLGGLTTSVGITQLLSPVAKASLSYQFVYLEGFLGNPYRAALIGPLPHPEAPPNERFRHNLQGQLSWYLPDTRTTLNMYMRLYLDSWNLGALTPEMRVYQSLGQSWVIRARYRYYAQTRADFALRDGETRYPVGYTGPVTNDPKMSEFTSHQVGLRITYVLAALRGTFDFASRVMLDVSLDREWCTSAFGNHWEGTLGGRIPF